VWSFSLDLLYPSIALDVQTFEQSVQKYCLKFHGGHDMSGCFMETKGRRLSLYAITGVVLASLIISGVYMSGVQFPSVSAQTGTLIVLLTDAPIDIAHLNVTIDSLSINPKNGSWIELPLVDNKTEVYFDLLSLQNVTMTLSDAEIPVGNYSKMRMTIKTANATLANGETLDLTVPSGKIDIVIHFEIENDDATVVLIDMQPDWVAISKSNRLRPVLKASVV